MLGRRRHVGEERGGEGMELLAARPPLLRLLPLPPQLSSASHPIPPASLFALPSDVPRCTRVRQLQLHTLHEELFTSWEVAHPKLGAAHHAVLSSTRGTAVKSAHAPPPFLISAHTPHGEIKCKARASTVQTAPERQSFALIPHSPRLATPRAGSLRPCSAPRARRGATALTVAAPTVEIATATAGAS
eukprot:2341444-Rhodomonas_salina.3